VLTGTLDIPTDNEPQPVVIFVSNSSGTETANQGKADSDELDSKTDIATEGEVWDLCRIFCIQSLK